MEKVENAKSIVKREAFHTVGMGRRRGAAAPFSFGEGECLRQGHGQGTSGEPRGTSGEPRGNLGGTWGILRSKGFRFFFAAFLFSFAFLFVFWRFLSHVGPT